MNIELRKTIPLPLVEIDHKDSEIWEAESLILIPGDRILIHAPSGRGKTTLLSMIYGIRKDYQGEILLDGELLSSMNTRKIATLRKKNLSYIFQGLELFEELTALENIMLKNRQTRFKSTQQILEMAEILEIQHFLDRKAGILSFGQQQRVAIIRALCQPINFLLADEIFSHLDEAIAQKAFELLDHELEQQEAGLLFTSLKERHDPFFSKKYRV